jgi:hypothetical protein
MGRQRASGVPGLLRRVRWGNLASLVLVASVVLLVVSGRSAEPEHRPRLVPAQRNRPPAEVKRAAPKRAETKRAEPRKRRHRERRRGGARVGVDRAEAHYVEPVEAQPVEPEPVETPPPTSGEFTPDPGP